MSARTHACTNTRMPTQGAASYTTRDIRSTRFGVKEQAFRNVDKTSAISTATLGDRMTLGQGYRCPLSSEITRTHLSFSHRTPPSLLPQLLVTPFKLLQRTNKAVLVGPSTIPTNDRHNEVCVHTRAHTHSQRRLHTARTGTRCPVFAGRRQ